jgi:phosphoadenosine phosphosulfate reductase
MDATQLSDASQKLAGKTPLEMIGWAAETFQGKLAIGTSLGAEAMVIMDLASRVIPNVPYIFLDTDFHFQDTLDLLEKARKRYKANIMIAKTELSPAQQAALHGDQLYFRDPSACCEVRKIEPMRKALKPYQAWLSGMRRDQTAVRANMNYADWDSKFGLVKVSPILDWSWDDVWKYIHENDVPYNRLHDMGYPSIGCAPCTKPVKPGDDPRSGRWAGFDKTECGLHTK